MEKEFKDLAEEVMGAIASIDEKLISFEKLLEILFPVADRGFIRMWKIQLAFRETLLDLSELLEDENVLGQEWIKIWKDTPYP